jgi:hypothetical protein
MSILKLGFNKDISNEDYHADTEYLSSSSLKMIMEDPEEFHKKYVLKEKTESKKSVNLDFGTYVHTLILEPHLVNSTVAMYPKRKQGKEWNSFKEKHPGKLFINEGQQTLGNQLANSFDNNRFTEELYREGEAEVTLCVEIEGIKIKVRTDWLDIHNNRIVDLKTTADSLGYWDVKTTIAKWKYDLSAALYMDAVAQHTGSTPEFIWDFLGKTCTNNKKFKCSEATYLSGRNKYLEAIARIKECRESGNYEFKMSEI